MKEFTDLAALIQIGTQRATVPQSPIIPDLPETTPERKALMLAGALGLMSRAGARPHSNIVALESAPEETLSVATRSARHLSEAIEDSKIEVILEWAAKAANLGLIVPRAVLLQLLPLLEKNPELAPVIGQRGHWLAQLQGLNLGDSGEAPQDRTWLTVEWPTLDWKERAKGIASLEADLCLADEPILQTALTDRRKEVREAACELLVRLDRSQFAIELAKMANCVLTLEKSFLRKTLVAHPPEPEDLPAGLSRTKARHEFGPKALALLDLLRHIPPGGWTQELNLSPEQILDLAEKSEYQLAIVDGLAEAAVRFNDPAWIEASFICLFKRGMLTNPSWPALAHRVSEATFERQLGSDLMSTGAIRALEHRRKVLSPDISRRVVRTFLGELNHHFLLRELDRFLDPCVLPLLVTPLEVTDAREKTRASVYRSIDIRTRLLASLD